MPPWQLAPEGLVPLALGSAFLRIVMLKWIAHRRLNVIDGLSLFMVGAFNADGEYGKALAAFVIGAVISCAVEHWSDRNA